MTLGLKVPSTRVTLGEGKGEVRMPGMTWGRLVFLELRRVFTTMVVREEVRVECGEEASKASKVHCVVTMVTISTQYHTPGSVADLVIRNSIYCPLVDLLP